MLRYTLLCFVFMAVCIVDEFSYATNSARELAVPPKSYQHEANVENARTTPQEWATNIRTKVDSMLVQAHNNGEIFGNKKPGEASYTDSFLQAQIGNKEIGSPNQDDLEVLLLLMEDRMLIITDYIKEQMQLKKSTSLKMSYINTTRFAGLYIKGLKGPISEYEALRIKAIYTVN